MEMKYHSSYVSLFFDRSLIEHILFLVERSQRREYTRTVSSGTGASASGRQQRYSRSLTAESVGTQPTPATAKSPPPSG